MLKEKQFELLKHTMIKTYLQYINTLKETSCADLDNFNKRMPLLRHYIDIVHINTEFRNFVLNNYHVAEKQVV